MKNLLSNQITRKFIDTVFIDGKESVNTPSGYKPIRCVHKTIPYPMFKIKTSNGFVLKCADNHILIDSAGNEIFAKDCTNKKIQTIHGVSKVVKCKDLKYEQVMYDLELYDGHLYYSNGILSHNTTTTAAAIVHYAIFNQDKSVAILANKDSTAREILSRIKMIIENLPFWLQPGVREWNKKSIEFDNNCRIMTSSTSSSAIRGFSINFLYVDECIDYDSEVCLRDKQTGEIIYKKIGELYDEIKRIDNKYEILTPDGFKDFSGIKKTNKEKSITFSFSNKKDLTCSFEHKIDTTLGYIKAENLEVADYVLGKNNELVEILNKEINNSNIDLYDIVEVDDDRHRFIANDITVSNCAFVPNGVWNDFFTSVYPTISSSKNSKIVLTSTPYGMNFYYKLWKEAVDNINGYSHFAVDWWEIPGRDEEWKEKTIKEIGLDRWKQEFEAQFMGSSNTLVDGDILKQLVFENPLDNYSSETLRIYELPEEDHVYVLIADVAEGVGIDSSTFHIIDITDKNDMRIVVTFDNPHEKPNVFHIRLAGHATQYNNAFIIVENNSYGREVAQNLHYDSEYENLIYEDDFGLKTTRKTKRLGCSHLKFLIEQRILNITDFDTLQQLSKFIKQNNGSFAAEKNEHDDLIAPLWLFAYFINNNELTGRFFDNDNLGKIIYKQNIEEMNDSMMPFGFINDGVNTFHDED